MEKELDLSSFPVPYMLDVSSPSGVQASMKVWRVFVIGDSLFADALICLLMSTGAVSVLGSAPTPDTALPQLLEQRPDAVIEAGAHSLSAVELGQLLAALPDFPLIRVVLQTEAIQVISSHRTGTRLADLLNALSDLTGRDPGLSGSPV